MGLLESILNSTTHLLIQSIFRVQVETALVASRTTNAHTALACASTTAPRQHLGNTVSVSSTGTGCGFVQVCTEHQCIHVWHERPLIILQH